ncbi:MAG TPA: hypothetical protein PK536_06995 [Ignavibacteria bacterium]|nr:hypothetical protein [Ignavibacteria bacterium]
MEKYQNSDGYKIISKLNHIGYSHNIFIQNSNELVATLQKYEDPDFSIPLQKENYSEYFKVVNKDLHNFLASVKTLVDHSRAVVEDLYPKDSEIRGKYDTEVKNKFENNPLVAFVQNLRNYTLHRKIPYVNAEMSFNVNEGFESSIKLEKSELLEWDGWKKIAKEYLKELPEKFSLLILMTDYKTTVINFYNWFYQEQQEYHKAEFEEFNILGKQIESFNKQINDLGTELLSKVREDINNKGLY